MWFWLGGTQQGPTTVTDTSAELLARMRMHTKRPANDRDLTDDYGYLYLTDAQSALMYRISAHIPDVVKSIPEKMTTADNGATYNTALDPLGHMEVYAAPYTQPLIEGPMWDERADFTREGPRTIRMSRGRARLFSDGPWARYAKKPGLIDTSSQPTLQPADARRIIPWQAAALWAESGGAHDPSPYLRQVQTLLFGDPNSEGDLGLIPSYKLQYSNPGPVGSSQELWYRNVDLGGGR